MRSIPVAILAGSDREAAPPPAEQRDLHPLASFKAARVLARGRPLIHELVARLGAARGFGPIVVAGPARVYEPLGLDAELLDTDGTVGSNLRRAIEHHQAGANGPLAILACDVLPTSGELGELRERYERESRSALWLPLVKAPDDPAELGPFAWKPTYLLRPAPDAEPVRVLPGHLAIFHPEMLRLELLYQLVDLAYRTRNRSIAYKRSVMVSSILGSLLWNDFVELLHLSAPTRTATVLTSGLRLARRLTATELSIPELEHLLGRIFLRTDRTLPGGLRTPVVECLALAEDVDMEEEARDFEGHLRQG